MLRDLVFHLSEQLPALAALATLVLVFLIGTAAQIFADRVRIPAIGPLLVAGFLLGPAVLGILQPDVLGVGLRVVIRAAVAVCVFEGGLLLDVSALRQTSRAVLGLVTVGLLITTLLAGLTAHLIVGWSWELSFLFGAIVSVTGPTVITPILQKVRVNHRVRATLESESVIADPFGVIIAALIFTAITSPGGFRYAAPAALQALWTGTAVGGGTAVLMWIAARRFHLLPAKFARLAILGTALFVYTLAEMIAHESGVLAAAVAGIVIGSLDMPHKQQVEEFKGDLASIAISAVFMLLAAGISPHELSELGWRAVAVVALLMFVIRPIRVFLSTIGSELRTNEKAFISLLGPRGIVAASVATFFALELIDAGYGEGRELVALVFAVVVGTVMIEGSLAGPLAKWFKVMPQHTLIIGSNGAARQLATRLAEAGESVAIIDTNDDSIARARELRGVRALVGDATDATVLRRAGAEDAKCLIAATESDKLNLLVSHVARASFRIPRFVAVANSPSNVPAFDAAGIETISPEEATATFLENMILRPSLYQLLTRDEAEHIAEVEVTRDSAGGTLRAMAFEGCVVVALRRKGKLLVPSGSTRLRPGDVLTILGTERAVDTARVRLRR